MAISIEGVRISNFTIQRDSDDGRRKVNGGYELISNNGITLAKQSFNAGYGSIDIPFSSETNALVEKLANQISHDIKLSLGLE